MLGGGGRFADYIVRAEGRWDNKRVGVVVALTVSGVWQRARKHNPEERAGVVLRRGQE